MHPEKSQMYAPIIAQVFLNNYRAGDSVLPYHRSEIQEVANEKGIALPKNIGDLLYSFRYRRDFPAEILDRTPEGLSWVILGAGTSRYRFMLGDWPAIVPQEGLVNSEGISMEDLRSYRDSE